MKNALSPRGGIKIFFIAVNAAVLIYIGKPSLPISVLLLQINDSLLPVFVDVPTKAASGTGLKSDHYLIVKSCAATIWFSWLAIRTKVLFSMHDSIVYRDVS